MVLWPRFQPLPQPELFVPKTGDHRIYRSFDLFLQHCLLLTLNPTHHIEVVYNDLREAIMELPKRRRQRLQKPIMKPLATSEMDMQPLLTYVGHRGW
jgi:hypothetical protein